MTAILEPPTIPDTPADLEPVFPLKLEKGESVRYAGEAETYGGGPIWHVTYREGFTYRLHPMEYHQGEYSVSRVLEDGSLRRWSAIFDKQPLDLVVKWTREESRVLADTHRIQQQYAHLDGGKYGIRPQVRFSLDLDVEELEPGRVWRVARFGYQGILILQGWGYALLRETGDFPETPNRKYIDGKRWLYAIQCIVGSMTDVPTDRMRLVGVDRSGQRCAVNGHDAGQSCESGKRNKSFPRFLVEVTGPEGTVAGTVAICAKCWTKRALGEEEYTKHAREAANVAWRLSEGKGSWLDWQERSQELTGQLIAAALDAGEPIPDVKAALCAEAMEVGDKRAQVAVKKVVREAGGKPKEQKQAAAELLEARLRLRAELVAWSEEYGVQWSKWFDDSHDENYKSIPDYPAFVPPPKPGPDVHVQADDTTYRGEDDDQVPDPVEEVIEEKEEETVAQVEEPETDLERRPIPGTERWCVFAPTGRAVYELCEIEETDGTWRAKGAFAETSYGTTWVEAAELFRTKMREDKARKEAERKRKEEQPASTRDRKGRELRVGDWFNQGYYETINAYQVKEILHGGSMVKGIRVDPLGNEQVMIESASVVAKVSKEESDALMPHVPVEGNGHYGWIAPFNPTVKKGKFRVTCVCMTHCEIPVEGHSRKMAVFSSQEEALAGWEKHIVEPYEPDADDTWFDARTPYTARQHNPFADAADGERNMWWVTCDGGDACPKGSELGHIIMPPGEISWRETRLGALQLGAWHRNGEKGVRPRDRFIGVRREVDIIWISSYYGTITYGAYCRGCDNAEEFSGSTGNAKHASDNRKKIRDQAVEWARAHICNPAEEASKPIRPRINASTVSEPKTTKENAMAQRTVVTLVDDLDGGEADETVTFAIDGKAYEIDLTTANAKKLRSALADYVEKGRRVGGKARRSSTPRPNNSGSAQAEIRAWAKENGRPINGRGRIPKAVLDEFNKAQGQRSNAEAATVTIPAQKTAPVEPPADQRTFGERFEVADAHRAAALDMQRPSDGQVDRLMKAYESQDGRYRASGGAMDLKSANSLVGKKLFEKVGENEYELTGYGVAVYRERVLRTAAAKS